MSVLCRACLSPKALSGERRDECVGDQETTTVQALRGKLFVR